MSKLRRDTRDSFRRLSSTTLRRCTKPTYLSRAYRMLAYGILVNRKSSRRS